MIAKISSIINAATKIFVRSRKNTAEGGCGGNSAAPERSAERSEAGQCRFLFLDLCIRFGKIISKVCEGFNSGASKKHVMCSYKNRLRALTVWYGAERA